MTDWTAYGAEYLAKVMNQWNSVPVVVQDSTGTVLASGIRATYLPFCQMNFDAESVNHPIGVEIDQTSFIFRVSDVPFEIRLGYGIIATINGTQVEWHVVEGPDGKAVSYFDKHRQQIQVTVENND